MEHKFTRTEALIGAEGLEKLHNSKVLIFGVGGVGSFTTEALARAGVGHLILVDFAEVSVSNLNRQIIALHSTVGQAKVDVMKRRIADINPDAQVETHKEFLTAENLNDLLKAKPDYVVDAIDTVSSKVILAKECLARQIPHISSMGAGNRLTAENFRVSDISKTSGDPLAKSMRKLLREEGIKRGIKVVFCPDPPITPLIRLEEAPAVADSAAVSEAIASKKRLLPGSISYVPSVAGLLIAGEVIRDLLGI